MKLRAHHQSILLALVLLIAAGLRFYALGTSSLWSDEGNTWALVQRSFAQIARDAAADIHPPGYYWLLKLWTGLFGLSAPAMRSLSAVAGVLLVWVIARIAMLFRSVRHRRVDYAPLAALIAALNPFQIYYSQEARMYMLLALEAAAVMWATVILLRLELGRPDHRQVRQRRALALYVVAAAAGLWTHYSFPIVLLAAGLAYLIRWVGDRRQGGSLPLLSFVVANLTALALFLPWLPTALDRVRAWPKGGATVGLLDGVTLVLRTLLVGPLREVPAPFWPWLVAAGLLPLVGVLALWRQRGSLTISLWFVAPIGLMVGLGLLTDAFLKFLLVASPAWCLLVAAAPHIVSLERAPDQVDARAQTVIPTHILQGFIALGALLFTLQVLPAYTTTPTVRDNYQGVADYLAATGNPATDLVLLDAPGQQDVWRYYDPGLPILALPENRPPDRAATEAALAAATAGERVYTLFWATDEADPDGIVEGWLDRNAFTGPESWQGNVRFVTYRVGAVTTCRPPDRAATFAATINLTEICLPTQPATPGDVLPVGLFWQTSQPLDRDFYVSVQLLNAAGAVIAQHDGAPAGGTAPTDSWQPGQEVRDQHGLSIPWGTPPGRYRLIVALYDPANGARLWTDERDAVTVGEIDLVPPVSQVPVDLLPIAHRANASVGPLTLLGYDLHRQGYAHAPETPVTTGDNVEVVLYWQAPNPLPEDWPADLVVSLALGEDVREFQPADGYPTGAWQPGEMVRSVVVLPYTGASRQAILRANNAQLELVPLPD